MKWLILPSPEIYGWNNPQKFVTREKDIAPIMQEYFLNGKFSEIHVYKLCGITHVQTNPTVTEYIVNDKGEVVPK